MKILFEIKGGIARESGKGQISLENRSGRTVADLLELLSLPRDGVGNVIVNGQVAGWETTLADGDRVIFFPVVAGG